ncbi:hypothetical protein EW146_g7132 [Bondarzewia mesenterica]|uniref:Uncharacterized protein n=1 Tax=Bondarzewia mesenterica TaxID=1095465 RepID=A0A4S4LLN3_9AGAM|nr:hypothetical protein EW146_g7132 [Bondarzewia mesenterica]
MDSLSTTTAEEVRTKEDVMDVATFLMGRFRLPLEIIRSIFELAEYWVVISTKRAHFRIIYMDSNDTPYISTSPIVAIQASPLRRIIFTTVSHDQGPSNPQNEGHETDESSYTGFETEGSNTSSCPRRLFQRNVRANRAYHTFTNVWDYHSPSPEIQAWLRGVQCWDVISVFAKAKHHGWANHVLSVEVVVHIAYF